MRDELSRQKEQEYSDRFDQGLWNVQDAEEECLFDAYRHIREGFHTLRIPEIAPDQIICSLLVCSPKQSQRAIFGFINHIPAPLFAAGYAAIVFLCLFSLYILLQTPSVLPVERIAFQSIESQQDISVPFLWERRIQQGSLVTIPNDVSATLQLADGSILSCSPETQIAIHYQSHHRIDIQSGAVTINAVKQPESGMLINTPLGQVRVIGTIFHIELQ